MNVKKMLEGEKLSIYIIAYDVKQEENMIPYTLFHFVKSGEEMN